VTAPPVHFYCYYRVDPARSSAAREGVAHMFRRVEERFGVVGRLLKGEREPELWMEVYEHVSEPDRLETLLSEICVALGFGALLAPGSARRIERFVAA
jgi:Domain of unknown function (DUF4936)